VAQEFHLRLITERAGGGDPIVRERHVPGPECAIGRAPENDIVLTDLSIDPKHARMRFSGPGRVRIESVGGLPFKVGDREVQGADLDAAGRPTVTFGTYHLALESGPDGGVVVTVTQDVDDYHPTPSIFSLQAKVFGRRQMAWTFAGGILLLCLLVPLVGTLLFQHLTIHPDEQWSSGPLSKAHAFLQQDCKACHANAFVSVRDQTCKSCHQATPDQAAQAAVARSRDAGSPFRPLLVSDHAAHDKLMKATPLPPGLAAKTSVLIQRAFNHPTDRCASCHVEHTKGKAQPGVSPAALGEKPSLVVVQDCQSCHARLKMRLTKTELIDTPDWNRHPAFRPLVMTAAGPTPQFQRATLAGRPQERNGLTFPHRLHLDPLGGVARQAIDLGAARGYGKPLECASCHQRDAMGKGFRPIEMERDCGGCHSLAYTRGPDGQLKFLPHGELDKVVATLAGRPLPAPAPADRMRPGTIRPSAFAASGASAYRATFSPGGACYDCHTINWQGDTVRMAPVKLTVRYLPRGAFDHSVPEHGGPGASKAGGFKCADCHKAQTSDEASDILIPDLGKCASCHGQPKSKTAAASDADCTSCHSFHAPGAATSRPGQPPLQALRWSAGPTGKPVA
jgi:hypothetical protein